MRSRDNYLGWMLFFEILCVMLAVIVYLTDRRPRQDEVLKNSIDYKALRIQGSLLKKAGHE